MRYLCFFLIISFNMQFGLPFNDELRRLASTALNLINDKTTSTVQPVNNAAVLSNLVDYTNNRKWEESQILKALTKLVNENYGVSPVIHSLLSVIINFMLMSFITPAQLALLQQGSLTIDQTMINMIIYGGVKALEANNKPSERKSKSKKNKKRANSELINATLPYLVTYTEYSECTDENIQNVLTILFSKSIVDILYELLNLIMNFISISFITPEQLVFLQQNGDVIDQNIINLIIYGGVKAFANEDMAVYSGNPEIRKKMDVLKEDIYLPVYKALCRLSRYDPVLFKDFMSDKKAYVRELLMRFPSVYLECFMRGGEELRRMINSRSYAEKFFDDRTCTRLNGKRISRVFAGY